MTDEERFILAVQSAGVSQHAIAGSSIVSTIEDGVPQQNNCKRGLDKTSV